MQTLLLVDDRMPWVADGRKRSTLRLPDEAAAITPGPIEIHAVSGAVPPVRVEVTAVHRRTYGALTEEDARSEGYGGDVDGLRRGMLRHYPSLTPDSALMRIDFTVLRG